MRTIIEIDGHRYQVKKVHPAETEVGNVCNLCSLVPICAHRPGGNYPCLEFNETESDYSYLKRI